MCGTRTRVVGPRVEGRKPVRSGGNNPVQEMIKSERGQILDSEIWSLELPLADRRQKA